MTDATVQRYARVAGLLLVISIVAGGFGELYVPGKLIVPNDASATAKNLRQSGELFRLGFAGYLVEAVCDVALTLIVFFLLKPVDKHLALLAAFFGLVGTSVFCFAELFYFSSSLLIQSTDLLASFSQQQLDSLAMLSLKVYGSSASLFLVFGGVGGIVTGYLIFLSGYLPKSLGVLFALGGAGFVVRNFAFVLAPAYAFDWLFLPTNIAMLAGAVWFLSRGVNLQKWHERRPGQAGDRNGAA